MPDSNKKRQWEKPAATEFSNLDEMRAYYQSRATPEEMERLDRVIERARKEQERRAAEHDGRRLRRWA